MSRVVFESVSKLCRNRPVLFNWIGRERRDVFFALHNLASNLLFMPSRVHIGKQKSACENRSPSLPA